jgi:hypothetical protein
MAGNGFRAARAVPELEQRTGRLVLQANQVLLWSIIAATNAPLTIKGWGTLLRAVNSQQLLTSSRQRRAMGGRRRPATARSSPPTRPTNACFTCRDSIDFHRNSTKE